MIETGNVPEVKCTDFRSTYLSAANFTTMSTADTRPGASRVVAPTSPVGAQPRGNSLSAVAAGATTQRVTGAVLNGRKRRQPLQSERQKVS